MIRLIMLVGIGAGVYWLYRQSPAGQHNQPGLPGVEPDRDDSTSGNIRDAIADFDPWDFLNKLIPGAVPSAGWPPVASNTTGGGGGEVAGTKRGIRNNNPGNIKWNSANKWQGQTGKDAQGFVIFDTPANGIRAMGILLENYVKGGRNTIDSIIRRYTSGDNSTIQTNYVNFVSSKVGIDKNLRVNLNLHKVPIVGAIIQFENGSNPWSSAQIGEWVK